VSAGNHIHSLRCKDKHLIQRFYPPSLHIRHDDCQAKTNAGFYLSFGNLPHTNNSMPSIQAKSFERLINFHGLMQQFREMIYLDFIRRLKDSIVDLLIISVKEVPVIVDYFRSLAKPKKYTLVEASPGYRSGPDQANPSLAIIKWNIISKFFFAVRRQGFQNNLTQYVRNNALMFGQMLPKLKHGFKPYAILKCHCVKLRVIYFFVYG